MKFLPLVLSRKHLFAILSSYLHVFLFAKNVFVRLTIISVAVTDFGRQHLFLSHLLIHLSLLLPFLLYNSNASNGVYITIV